MVTGSRSLRGLLARGALLLAAAAIVGFLVAWSGVYDVAASKGHWPITNWLLSFAMRNSVETHAGSRSAPDLDEPIFVQLGIAHYAGACTPCHGGPGERRNPVPLGAVPEPPYLPDVIGQWTPEQIFWIVKHGIKYTSMPAWPAQERDDEVWAIVAAAMRLPELDPAEFRRIASGAALLRVTEAENDARRIARVGAAGASLVACARCHGLLGTGREPDAFPRLAGMSQQYLYESLRAYAHGGRPSGIMQPVAAELSDEQMRKLAAYFASLPSAPPAAAGEVSEEVERRGRAIALAGVPRAGVPACAPCHGPGEAPLHPLYPALAGQPRFYLVQQLRLWRSGVRDETPYARIMTEAARHLDDAQIDDVAAYYAAGAIAPGDAPRGSGSQVDEDVPVLPAPEQNENKAAHRGSQHEDQNAEREP